MQILLFTQQLRKLSALVLMSVMFLSSQPCFAISQKQFDENVLPLAEAAAILNICFESIEYSNLSDDKALDLFGLSMRLEDLVQQIADQYNDEALPMTYGMMYMEMSSDPEIMEYARSEYQYCSNKLLKDMKSYVDASERQIKNNLLNK